MRLVVSLVSLVPLLFLGCAEKEPRLNQENDIYEAVFRYQFTNNIPTRKDIAAFYISVAGNDRDPSDEFLKRFAGYHPPVRKFSDCTIDGKGVKDKATGLGGLHFSFSSMRWISSNKVEVEGGIYRSGLYASVNLYTVVKRKGKWVVTKDKVQWQS